jgi:uncharacterized protein (TIGR00297 family)
MASGFLSDAGVALAGLAAVALLFLAVGALAPRIGLDRYAARNLGHAGALVICAIGVNLVAGWEPVVVATGVGAIFVVVGIEAKLLPGVLLGERRRDYGIVASAVAVGLVAFLWWPNRGVITGALLVLALADPAAAFVGRLCGRHVVAAWGARRTVEGAAAYAAVTLPICLIVLAVWSGLPGIAAVPISVMIALSAAGLELATPPAFDNLLAPLWAAAALDLAARQGPAGAADWAVAGLVAGMAGFLSYRLGWLDRAGSVGAALVSAVTLLFGGWMWLLLAATFFGSSSLLTKLRQRDPEAKAPRDIGQVWTNGALPMVPMLAGHAAYPGPLWFVAAVGAFAAANGDTWASELGRLSPRPPRSIVTLRPAPAGTPGAVSLQGLVAAAAGGALIGAVAMLAGPLWLIPVGLGCGVAGSLADSLAGALWQAGFRCPICNRVGESRAHCGLRGRVEYGLPWLDNNGVNAFGILVGLGAAAGSALLIIR